MPIKYKSTHTHTPHTPTHTPIPPPHTHPHPIVLAKLLQYGSKIVYLLQDKITESSPKALKDAKTWKLPEAPPPPVIVTPLNIGGRHLNILPWEPHLLATPLSQECFRAMKIGIFQPPIWKVFCSDLWLSSMFGGMVIAFLKRVHVGHKREWKVTCT